MAGGALAPPFPGSWVTVARRARRPEVPKAHVEGGLGVAVGGVEGEGGGAGPGAHSQELCQGGLAEVQLSWVHLGRAGGRQDSLVGPSQESVLTGKDDI